MERQVRYPDCPKLGTQWKSGANESWSSQQAKGIWASAKRHKGTAEDKGVIVLLSIWGHYQEYAAIADTKQPTS